MRAALGIAEVGAILLAVGLLGFPLVRGIPKLSRPELAAWAWAAGLIALAAAEGTLALLGLRPDPWKLWGLLGVLSFLFRSRSSAAREPLAPSRLARIVWALALAALALFTIEAIAEPMWVRDFITIWGLKGKTLFLAGGLPERLFRDPAIDFVHPEYPLLLPAIFAAVSTLLGSWDPQALALLYPGFELATLLVTWGFLRRRAGPFGAAAATLLTAGFFQLYGSLSVGLAEIPLAFGLLLAGTALLDALDSDDPARLRPLVLAALWCCALKREGAVALLLLAAAALRPAVDRRRSSAAVAVFVLVPLLHQAALRGLRGPTADRSFGMSLLDQGGAARLVHRALEIGQYVIFRFIPADFPFLLPVAVLLALTASGIADLLLPPLAALAALYAFLPVVSKWPDPVLFAQATFERVILALFPPLFLALGARISASVERFSLPNPRERTTMK